MRYLLAIILTAFLASPAVAESYCSITGPHNCNDQISEQLTNITKNTIHNVQMSQDPHPFKTDNDRVLAAANSSTQEQNSNQEQNNAPSVPAWLAFWTK